MNIVNSLWVLLYSSLIDPPRPFTTRGKRSSASSPTSPFKIKDRY